MLFANKGLNILKCKYLFFRQQKENVHFSRYIMKRFDQNFRTELWKTIEDIENHSLVEIVVLIKPRSDRYAAVPVWWGVGFLFATFAFLLFSPFTFDFNNPLVYGSLILSFFVGYLLAAALNPLQRLFLRKEKMKKQAEIMGRAYFQKGGMRHTNDKIGTLIYCSVFEKCVCIIPDRGAENAIPPEDWEKIRTGFNSIFATSDPAKALLNELKACQPIFSEYIPPIENDINEIPDDLDIEL